MKCESSICMEMDSCEFCKNVADKYLQTLKIIVSIEQLLDELTRGTVAERIKVEGTYSAILFAVTPLLTSLLGPVNSSNILLAGLQAAAATALATVLVKRALSEEDEAAFSESTEVDLKSAEPNYFDIEELSIALNQLKKLAEVYKLILNKCAEKCDVRMGKEKTA